MTLPPRPQPRPAMSLPPLPGAKPASAPAVEVESEAAGSEEPAEPEDPETARMIAGYVGPEQRCNSCSHCDESSTCTLYEFTCEPEGGCPDHKSKGEADLASEPPPEE